MTEAPDGKPIRGIFALVRERPKASPGGEAGKNRLTEEIFD